MGVQIIIAEKCLKDTKFSMGAQTPLDLDNFPTQTQKELM